MAEKFYSKYTAAEIEQILNDSDLVPFVIYYDKKAQVYRFFRTAERRDAWVEAYNSGEGIPPEIAAYEFTDSFTAPAPYSITINGLKDNQYILYGTTGNTIDYTFLTVSGTGQEINESVDVYYTFKTPTGTISTSSIYNAGQQVKMNIDDYLSIGTNVITLLIRGRSTGTTKMQVVTYYVVELSISSTFDISRPIEHNSDIEVRYTVKGQSGKTVQFYIDGILVASSFVSELDSELTALQKFDNSGGRWEPGVHTLQIRAFMSQGDQQFYSKVLYYEFVITGIEQTVILIETEFPSTVTPLPSGTKPGLNGEQYVPYILNWAYYSSNSKNATATITWRLHIDPQEGEEGYDTTLATRNADVVQGENGKRPDPLNFMPTDIGSYYLQALLTGTEDVISNYTIIIIPNTSGLQETTTGLTMKLSGLGRSNDEPDTEENPTRSSWTNNGYSATFYHQPWNDNSGWDGDALVLNNGATSQINIKPFGNLPIRNGCVVELDFETFNVSDDDAILIKIGNTTTVGESVQGTQLLVKPSQAILRSYNGVEISTRFKSDERVKLAFVIHPTDDPTYPLKMFVYSNGILSAVAEYKDQDNFNSQEFIQLGNAVDDNNDVWIGSEANRKNIVGCNAGIKIYYIRVYTEAAINMYQELNNYIIDSGDITRLVAKNDIYEAGTRTISVDKLESSITTVKITGPLDDLINKGSKNSMYGALEIVCPSNSNINMHCDKAFFNNAGQSTLDKPIPSLHVKLNKDETNVCYDRDGNILPKNRWAFREGNIPERKFRLQANYMDSSCAHNGAFLRLFNEVSPRLKVGDDYVLRIPAEKYAYDQYPTIMQQRHGDDPRGLGWAFPYNIHMVPDSIPCVVVWRENDQKPFKFLGQYVIMEEKKANYSNGMHSIYDTVDDSGNPDPFQFRSKTGNKLWDNEGCHQMELLTSTDDMDLFLDDSDWNRLDDKGELIRENQFELIYPDEDDLTDAEIEAEWQLFYDTFLHPICETKGSEKYHNYRPGDDISSIIRGNQTAFNQLYGTKLSRWHFAAYYCLALRNCCSDSMARNIELTSYDGGQTWLPKWWDVDMQCGLYQTGQCNLEPMTLRSTFAPGTNDSFALSGRNVVSGKLHSSWLWDGLERCTQFQEDVKKMDKALYEAGWTYRRMNEILDDEYVNTWSESLYNHSGIQKYLNFNQFTELQGSRTPHRHWFLKTSYDYFDAVNVCGEYTSKTINVRTEIPEGHVIRIKAGVPSFFGWGTSISNDVTGIKLEKGEEYYLPINRSLQLNNPLHIFSASKIEELDLSDVAIFLASNLDLSKTYDEVSGTYLRKVILGVTNQQLSNGQINKSKALNIVNGIEVLTKAELFNIQGLYYMTSLNMSKMNSLREFYAAGTLLGSFNPASGSNLSVVQLPTTITSMNMSGCSLTNNGECSISWFNTTQGAPVTRTEYREYVANDDGVSGSWVLVDYTPGMEVDGEVYDVSELPTTAEYGTVYRVVYTDYVYSIDSADVPITINNLSFQGMGKDSGTQKLIETWLTNIQNSGDADNILLTCALNYSYVDWEGDVDPNTGKTVGIPISILRTLAKIPRRNRTITGYIKVRGTGEDGSFTAEEMNFLLDNYGENIFDLNNSLCIDCVAGNIIISATGEATTITQDGIMHILQGTNAQLSSRGFPLRNEGTYYIWAWDTGNGVKTGSETTPNIWFDNNNVHYRTGYLTTTECSTPTKTYTLVASRMREDGSSEGSSKSIDVEVVSRKYPKTCRIVLINPTEGSNSAEYIEGSGWQITEIGTYVFNIEFDIPFKYRVNAVIDLGNISDAEEDDLALVLATHKVYKFDGTNWAIDSSYVSSTYGSYTYTNLDDEEVKDYYLYDGTNWNSSEYFNGTMKEDWGAWTLTGAENANIQIDDGFSKNRDVTTQFRMVVKTRPSSQVVMSLQYHVNWKNDTSLDSEIVPISIINNSAILSQDSIYGNTNLYEILNTNLEIPHEETSSYKALELKSITKDIIVPYSSTYKDGLYNLYSNNHNVAGYLTNVKVLNLEYCPNVNRNKKSDGGDAEVGQFFDINIAYDDLKFETVKLNPNAVVNVLLPLNPIIKELTLGKPTEIKILNPVNLTSNKLSVGSSINLVSLEIISLKDNKTFTAAATVVSNGGTTNLTHVLLQQSKSIEETVNSNVIDNLASMLTDAVLIDLSSGGTSKLEGNLYCSKLYETSRTKLVNNTNLTIRYDYVYLEFIDRVFRSLISDIPANGGWGDGYGLTTSEAASITDFGNVLKDSNIVNLSDMGNNLTNITFGDKTELTSPFSGCSNLAKIKFPASLTVLGSYTFVRNNKLTDIDFSSCANLTSIHENAFYNCTGKAKINLSSCQSLESADLRGLTNLDEIVIENNPTITTLKI